MKPTITLPLGAYAAFLVFIIATQLSIPTGTAAASDGAVVYDVDGKGVLDYSAPYYIGPVIWARGGGIKLTNKKNNNPICPYYVVQDPGEINKGGKFTFTMRAKQTYLRTGYALGIDSGSPTGSCNKSTFWKIPDAEGKDNLVTTGGLFETAVSCFQVVDYPKPSIPKVHSYMLQHCPFACGAGPLKCFNISLHEEKGVRYLSAGGGTPFEFVFQKA